MHIVILGNVCRNTSYTCTEGVYGHVYRNTFYTEWDPLTRCVEVVPYTPPLYMCRNILHFWRVAWSKTSFTWQLNVVSYLIWRMLRFQFWLTNQKCPFLAFFILMPCLYDPFLVTVYANEAVQALLKVDLVNVIVNHINTAHCMVPRYSTILSMGTLRCIHWWWRSSIPHSFRGSDTSNNLVCHPRTIEHVIGCVD